MGEASWPEGLLSGRVLAQSPDPAREAMGSAARASALGSLPRARLCSLLGPTVTGVASTCHPKLPGNW